LKYPFLLKIKYNIQGKGIITKGGSDGIRISGYGDDRIPEIWPVALNEPLPDLPIPLLPPDPDVILHLNEAVKSIYDRAAYARRIDYQPPLPPPKLRPSLQGWWDNFKLENK
jgi:hypothetical protein